MLQLLLLAAEQVIHNSIFKGKGQGPPMAEWIQILADWLHIFIEFLLCHTDTLVMYSVY